MAKGKKTGKSKKKLAESLPDGFEESAQQMSEAELKDSIQAAARLKIGYKKTMKEDPDVLAATEALQNVKEDYIADIKACDAKMEFCALLLDERGAVCQ